MAEQNAPRPAVRMKVESDTAPQAKTGPQIRVAGTGTTEGSGQVAMEKAAAEKTVVQSAAPASESAPRPKVEAPPVKVDAPSAAVESKQVSGDRPATKAAVVVEQPEVEQPAAQRPAAQVKASVVVERPEVDQPAQAQVPPETNRTTEQVSASDIPTQPSAAPNTDGHFNRARMSAVDWVRKTFPGHEHAFWGGVLALFIALLVFMIGLWRVLFIGIVVIIGVAVGQVLDGDPKLVNAIRNLLDSERGQR